MMKVIVIVILIVVLWGGCSGKQHPIDPELYLSLPGSVNGALNYDSDKVYEPSERWGPYIW
jgi:hypothetical protein